jgi:hypothetical protein
VKRVLAIAGVSLHSVARIQPRRFLF